jgi:hypothetical protein
VITFCNVRDPLRGLRLINGHTGGIAERTYAAVVHTGDLVGVQTGGQTERQVFTRARRSHKSEEGITRALVPDLERRGLRCWCWFTERGTALHSTGW